MHLFGLLPPRELPKQSVEIWMCGSPPVAVSPLHPNLYWRLCPGQARTCCCRLALGTGALSFLLILLGSLPGIEPCFWGERDSWSLFFLPAPIHVRAFSWWAKKCKPCLILLLAVSGGGEAFGYRLQSPSNALHYVEGYHLGVHGLIHGRFGRGHYRRGTTHVLRVETVAVAS